jgi:hypothetical protein
MSWSTHRCPRCRGEGRTVEVPGTRVNGSYKNRWCPGGVLMTWDEQS